MKQVSALLTSEEIVRYKRISKLNMRSSIYDLTTACNLRCAGCFFYSSGADKVAKQETDNQAWVDFVAREKERGVNLAILIGGEPTLYPDRIDVFYQAMATFVATNGMIKIDRARFPDLMVGISVWGDAQTEIKLRGVDVLAAAEKNYAGDPNCYVLYTMTPPMLGRSHETIARIRDLGLKVHMQLYSNDDGEGGFDWTAQTLETARDEMDGLLDEYPDTVVSSKYYHRVLTSGQMLGRTWGWHACPSVSLSHDTRVPRPKRLPGFERWASDLKTTHRCCTSATRDCDACHDGAATMSWIMVNKRAHMRSREDFLAWLEVYEMFAKLYRFIPW